MKKIFILIFCMLAFSANAGEKKTTFNKELFDKAQSDGKISTKAVKTNSGLPL